MGLFKLTSWDGDTVEQRSKKKHLQKRKKFQDKEKFNITTIGNAKKAKKSKLDLTTRNISVNEAPESFKKEKKDKMKNKLLPNNSTNHSPMGKKVKKRKQLLSSKISREILPAKKKLSVALKGPVLEKVGNVVNKKQAMTIIKNKKKFAKGDKNLETEKLVGNSPQNKFTNSPMSGKKEKKRKQFKLKTEGSGFKEAVETVLEKCKNVVVEKTAIRNKRKKSGKRKRSEFEDEEIIESKRRKNSKEDKIPVIGHSPVMLKNSAQNKFNKNFNVNTLKRMLDSKQKENKKRQWDNSPSSLRERMLAQLRSSRFRFINETLYNNSSFESRKYFKDDPEAFNAYHNGFQQQVDKWPLNPVNTIIESIKKMPKDYIVADFGCGDAKLAEAVPQKVHSFDFVALNDKVTACDMAHTPLLKSGVNVVVFCLSLMGTNLNDYLLEANRVLKTGGIMKIAEVESRFENIDEFIKLLYNYGFVNTWKDLSKDLFYFLDFKKERDIEKGKKKLPAIELKSCVYKRR